MFRRARHRTRARRNWPRLLPCLAVPRRAVPPGCGDGESVERAPPLDPAGQASGEGFGKRCGTVFPGTGGVWGERGAASPGAGVSGRAERPSRRRRRGGAGGVANSPLRGGVQRGGRVPLVRRKAPRGSGRAARLPAPRQRGRGSGGLPPANGSPSTKPPSGGDCAGCLVSKVPAPRSSAAISVL
jgi:hypothetical protein